jgi:hypothetical protein
MQENIIDNFERIWHHRNGRDAVPEFNKTVDACYYGCSWTAGSGIAPDKIWHRHVDADLNYLSNNFGIPGAGIDEILYVFASTTQFIKMKRAVFLLPRPFRQTMVIDNGHGYSTYFRIQPNCFGLRGTKLEAAKTWYRLPKEYHIDQARMHIGLIEYIARLNNIQCYWGSWDSITWNMVPAPKTIACSVNDRLGTDQSHPGPIAHRVIADQFIELITRDTL